MSSKSDILLLSEKINGIDDTKFIFHRNRLSTILKRVKLIVKEISESLPDGTALQALMLLYITLEEIFEYAILFSN
jgi:hypothetical protein